MMYKSWKFWASLGAGVITGGVVGILYAPMSGEQMRRHIGKSAANFAEGASNAANRIADAAQSGVALYGTSAGALHFQLERFYKAAAAGVEEAAIVSASYKDQYKS